MTIMTRLSPTGQSEYDSFWGPRVHPFPFLILSALYCPSLCLIKLDLLLLCEDRLQKDSGQPKIHAPKHDRASNGQH